MTLELVQWMDGGWPAVETDTSRPVMKTPATKAKTLFKVVMPMRMAATLSIRSGRFHHFFEKVHLHCRLFWGLIL